jgi:hypothetical protein
MSGRKQIDYMFISRSLLPALLRSGVLSHHSLTLADHPLYYLDFNSLLLFSDPAFHIEPASRRKLRQQDPRVVKQYISTLFDKLSANNIFSRLETLQLLITNNAWSPECIEEYESVDKTITESMLSTETSLS